MKNEEYLLRLSRVMEKIKDDIFVNFINELFHKVSDNYDLLDTKDLPCKSPNPGEGKPFYGDDLLDQLKASRICLFRCLQNLVIPKTLQSLPK